MLRASSETQGEALDARAITDPSIDPLVEGGRRLIGFVDAVLGGGDVADSRASLGRALGSDAVVDASATIANFEMMNRVAEGTGMPVGKGSLARTEEWRSLIGLDRYLHR
jgi:hypothetical protein